jgi:hypothetical protein
MQKHEFAYVARSQHRRIAGWALGENVDIMAAYGRCVEEFAQSLIETGNEAFDGSGFGHGEGREFGRVWGFIVCRTVREATRRLVLNC